MKIMKILILGGDGMLGHKMFQVLQTHNDVYVTFREINGLWAQHPLYSETDRDHMVGGIDALDILGLQKILQKIQPTAVVNCIGIVKQRYEAKSAVPSIQVNALFPSGDNRTSWIRYLWPESTAVRRPSGMLQSSAIQSS